MEIVMKINAKIKQQSLKLIINVHKYQMLWDLLS